jgi:NADPH:quinone reductase
MKAAYIESTGPAANIQIGELPDPAPGDGELLVRVHAAAINPIDTYIRGGVVQVDLPSPWIPGCDFAGVVESVGNNVPRFSVGDRVWGSNQGLFGRQGTLSELCTVEEQWMYSIPDNVDYSSAAAGALAGITAHLGLFLHAKLKSGEVLFVNGGAGGVGSNVVQLAKAAGATVITTAGSESNAKACTKLGATHVIRYRDEDVDQRVAEITAATGPIDVWFETLRTPALDRCVPLMKKRGRIVLMAGRDARPEFPVGPFYVKDLRLIGFAMFNADAKEQRVAADELNRHHATGNWKPRIGKTMPLSEAAAAHQLQEDNTQHQSGTLSGKIVVIP